MCYLSECLFMKMHITSDCDVDSVAPLASILAPVFSAVCEINRFDGADRRSCCHPVTDTCTDFSLSSPLYSPSSFRSKTLTVN